MSETSQTPVPPHPRMQTLHLWVSVLPATGVTLVAAATMGLLLANPNDPVTVSIALAAAAALTLIILIGALLGARHATQHLFHAIHGIRRINAQGHREHHHPPTPPYHGRHAPDEISADSDPLTLLVHELRLRNRADQYARDHAGPTAEDTRQQQIEYQQQIEVFTNVTWRMQSLVHRMIGLLDHLEDQIEDPDLLKGLFTIDHLTTRMRRQAESLAVLGGTTSRRQWDRPVTLYEVLRSAVSEIENYARVKVIHPVTGTLDGSAVVDVIHLLAELIDNATKFSAPQSTVLMRAETVTAGIAVEIDDRGLGMDSTERTRINTLLADPDQINLGQLLSDGRIGLYVVAILARKHDVRVELRPNIYGGTESVVVIPTALVGTDHDSLAQPELSPPPQYPMATTEPEDPTPASPPAPTAHPHGHDLPRRRAHHPTSNDERPPLPQRDAQTHMAPQLRTGQNPPAHTGGADTTTPTPGLFAAFRDGINDTQTDPPDDDTPPGSSTRHP